MRGLAVMMGVLAFAAMARAQSESPEVPPPGPLPRAGGGEGTGAAGLLPPDGVITERSAYDHRAPADHSAEEALRWIPRTLLAPMLGLTLLRREGIRVLLEPVGPPPSTPDSEEEELPPLGAMPVLMLENDRSPAVGVFVVVRPATGLVLDATFQHWDDERIEGWLRAVVALDADTALVLRGDGSTRGDRVFHGFAWDSRQEARTRYRHHQGGGRIALVRGFFESSELALGVRVTHHRFGASGYGGNPSLDAQVEPSSLPPGFADGATVLEERLGLTVDSRERPGRAPSEGLRLRMLAAHGADLEGSASWMRAGAELAGTAALAPEHDLTLSGWAAAVEPLGGAEPPFVEQVILGGRPGRLAGFLRGRLIGRSAALIHARYRWGIGANLDAALHVEAGNVFGARFEDLRVDRSRLSFGLSIDSLADDAHRVGLLFAMATEPLVDGADVTAGHVSFFLGSPPR